MPPKEKCPYCGKLYNPSKLDIHLKYHCGPNAIKTSKQSKQSKKNKSGQSSKMDGELKHNSIKKKKGEMCLGVEGNEKSFLHTVKWQRIILDEVCVNLLWLKSIEIILGFLNIINFMKLKSHFVSFCCYYSLTLLLN
jgi:hypothetical protein